MMLSFVEVETVEMVKRGVKSHMLRRSTSVEGNAATSSGSTKQQFILNHVGSHRNRKQSILPPPPSVALQIDAEEEELLPRSRHQLLPPLKLSSLATTTPDVYKRKVYNIGGGRVIHTLEIL